MYDNEFPIYEGRPFRFIKVVFYWCNRCGYNASDPHPRMYKEVDARDLEEVYPGLSKELWVRLAGGVVKVHTPMYADRCGGILVPRGWTHVQEVDRG